MTQHRSPTPEQWIGWGSRRLSIDASIFRERCDLFALVAALEMGYVSINSDNRRDELAGRLTNILWRMLKRPPYKAAAREFAIATIEETALLNGFALEIRDRERAVLAQEAGRALGTPAKVRDWLAAHLVQLGDAEAQNARIDVVRRFGPLHREPARMFVSCASHAADEATEELSVIFAQIRELAQDAAERARPAWSDGEDERIDDDGRSLLGAMTASVPMDHDRWARSPEIHCPKNRRALWRANALVICGFGGGSHGTGCEHSSVPLSTPCLYVGRAGETVPSAVAGALNMRHADVLPFTNGDDVPNIVAWWTRSRWPDIERSQRFTEVRAHTFAELRRRFSEAFEALMPAQISGALRNAGLAPELEEALTSVHGLACTSTEIIQLAAAAFGFHAPGFLDAAVGAPLNDLQLDALSHFQHEYSLLPSNASALRREAERQQLLGVLRFSLTNLGEWRDFRKQLRAEGST